MTKKSLIIMCKARYVELILIAVIVLFCNCTSNNAEATMIRVQKGEFIKTLRGGYIYLDDITSNGIVFKRTSDVGASADALSALKSWNIPLEGREPWYHIGNHEHLHIVSVDVANKVLTLRLTSDVPKGISDSFNF